MRQRIEAIGIIPARFGSRRFPGKPLADILGRPMFWHVYAQASKCCALGRVVLATDDARIAAAARALKVPWVMTRGDHRSGSDRVLEAADRLGVAAEAVVVNIQGDEPALNPRMLGQLLKPFGSPQVAVATLARRGTAREVLNPDRVKVVFSRTGDALYFSRAALPHARGSDTPVVYIHLGMYAYRLEALRRFAALPAGRLEKAEGLEQLRFMENGIPIRVVATRFRCIGVDRPEDIAPAARIISRRGGMAA
jgi:3-deoxy-manno-octulosonate cytidylyltransferase (CMP-KDO synthetase)